MTDHFLSVRGDADLLRLEWLYHPVRVRYVPDPLIGFDTHVRLILSSSVLEMRVQRDMVAAICEIDRQSKRHPKHEPNPSIGGQTRHQKQRRERAHWRNQINRRRSEGARQFRLPDAQRQNADTYQNKGG